MPAASVSLTWSATTSSASAHDALADYLAATIDGVARPLDRAEAGTRARRGRAWLAGLGRPDAVVHLPDDAGHTSPTGRRVDRSERGCLADDAFRLCFDRSPERR